MSAPASPAEDRPTRLTATEAETLAVYVAELSTAGLPLAPGVRAAAEEAGGRLADALAGLAEALERGEALESALRAPVAGFPRYLQGLVLAALRTGQLGETLIDLVEHRRAVREQWRSVTSAIAYPGILLSFAVAMFLTLSAFLAPAMESLTSDLNVQVPVVATWMVTVGRYGAPVILGALAMLLASAAVARLAFGAAGWRRMLGAIPLFGPLWHWSATAEMARMMAALVKRQVALPEALRLTADGLSDANIAAVCRRLAVGVDQGRDLALLMVLSRRLPASLAPLIRWGQNTGRLDEAFQASAEMLEARVRLRASLLRTILPPFVFLAAAALALALFVGFLAPAVTLIQWLA
jgi:type II secretory pathway component PulF